MHFKAFLAKPVVPGSRDWKFSNTENRDWWKRPIPLNTNWEGSDAIIPKIGRRFSGVVCLVHLYPFKVTFALFFRIILMSEWLFQWGQNHSFRERGVCLCCCCRLTLAICFFPPFAELSKPWPVYQPLIWAQLFTADTKNRSQISQGFEAFR